MLSGRFINAARARFAYNPNHVCYYQVEDNGKIKLHFSNGDSKDLDSEEARLFLTEVERVVPVTPSQAA